MKKILTFIFLFSLMFTAPLTWAAGPASEYQIIITKMELYNGSSWVTVFSGTSTAIDIAAAASGTSAGNFFSGLEVPDGTYTQVRTTVSTTFVISGTDAGQYTTAATFDAGGGNVGCVANATAANEAACTATISTVPIDTTTFSSPITMTNGNASHKIRINFDTNTAISYNGGAGAIFPDVPTVTVTAISVQ